MGAGRPFHETPSLRVDALTIARGGRVLFENVSLGASPGGYVEIVGANGSGKTSLLRAIAGFLRPRAGRVVFDGAAEPALALHYVGHQNGLKPTADVRAHLRYWAGLFGGAANEDAVFKALGLGNFTQLPARALSQGQARRLALARLIVAPRPVWLLDEPAAALDAGARAALRELVDAHRANGGIALAAVHEPLGPAPSAVVTL